MSEKATRDHRRLAFDGGAEENCDQPEARNGRLDRHAPSFIG
jgi:hypothetical protein